MVHLWRRRPRRPRRPYPPSSCPTLLCTGPESFISTFDSLPAIDLPGATLRLVTADDSYGLSLTGMSALHVSGGGGVVLRPSGQQDGGRTWRPGPAVSQPPTLPAVPAAVQITLDPCTILQPHVHPHGEFTYTISGKWEEPLSCGVRDMPLHSGGGAAATLSAALSATLTPLCPIPAPSRQAR